MYPIVPRIRPASVLEFPACVGAGAVLIGLRPRQAEIEQLDVAVRPDHYVVGFDVAMDDLRGVRHRQGFRHLPRDADDAWKRQPLRRQFPQRLALDQLHRDVAIGVDDAGLVDGDDVRVIEGGGEGRLAEQAIEHRLVVDGHAPDDFQCDLSAEPRIKGAIDLAHAARAEMQANFVRPERAARWQAQRGRGGHLVRDRGMIAK